MHRNHRKGPWQWPRFKTNGTSRGGAFGAIVLASLMIFTACAKPGAFEVSAEARARLFTEPTEPLQPIAPEKKSEQSGAYSIYRLVDAKISADMRTRQISARIRVESSAGSENVDMLGDVREDGRATLVDLDPISSEQHRLTAQAYCSDSECKRIILDVYFKVGSKTYKQQFVTGALAGPKKNQSQSANQTQPQAPQQTQTQPATPQPGTPQEPQGQQPKADEDIFNEGTGGSPAGANDELSGDNQEGEYVGAGRDEEMIKRLLDRPEKPEPPKATQPQSPAPSTSPVPANQPSKPPQHQPAPQPQPAPQTPAQPPAQAQQPAKPPQTQPAPLPIPPPPPRPQPPATQPTEPLIPVPPPKPQPAPVPAPVPAPEPAKPPQHQPAPQPQPAPQTPAQPPAEPPRQSEKAPLTPAQPVDPKLQRERELAPLINLREGGRATGYFNDGAIERSTKLPADGPSFHQVYPQRDTHWATGMMVSLMQNASARLSKEFPGTMIMVGDISIRGGGPIPSSSHHSHQSGLDIDVPYIGNEGFQIVIDGRGRMKDSFDYIRNWQFFRIVASQKIVQDGEEITVLNRIFVNPAIKRELCAWAKDTGLLNNPLDAEIMRRIRPAEGHDKHFHLRLRCSPHYPDCRNQVEPAEDSGC